MSYYSQHSRISDDTVDHLLKVLNETYIYYMENPDRRGVDEHGSCLYRTDDGKKCAIGRCMKRPTTEMSGSADGLYRDQAERYEIALEDRLKPAYQGLPVRFWTMLQAWHDGQHDWRVFESTGEGHLLHQGYLEIYKMAVGGEFRVDF